MTPTKIDSRTHGFEGFEISWAGQCPWIGKACFGSEDGKLFLPVGGSDEQDEGFDVLGIFEEESINGVAFSGEFIAISSRSEVVVGARRSLSPGRINLQRLEPSFKGGAHGMVARKSGGFIAPLGLDGLLLLYWNGDRVVIQVGETSGQPVDFYKLISLDDGLNGEVFACAARDSGLLAFTVNKGLLKSPIVGHRIESLDIIDLCSLGSSSAPRAMVAMNRDGKMLWMMDVLERKPPLLIDIHELTGAVYSLLSAQGHIFILTSTELVTLPNLATNFLSRAPMDRPLGGIRLPLEAVDFFLFEEDALYVITSDGELIFRITDLVAGVVGNRGQVISHPTPAVSFVPSILKQNWSPTEATFGELVAT